MRYAVVIQKAGENYAAMLPDLPGCIATGDTVQQTLDNLRDAAAMHVEAMIEDHDPVPDPVSLVDYIDISIPIAVP